MLYHSPIISTLNQESLRCRLQATGVFPDCDTDPCGADVGEGSVCCIFPAGCEPGFDDDDIRVQFFIPNRTDPSTPSCVISASDPDKPGSPNYTTGACNLVLINPACGTGQIWQITCAFGDTNVVGDPNEDVCLHSGVGAGLSVTINCEGNSSGGCDNVFLLFP